MNNFREIHWPRILAIAIPIFLLLFGLLWLFDLRYIPDSRARLFQSPISDIKSIRISPGGNLSLVEGDFVITNAEAIQKIMTAIRSARQYSPNHPADRWTCKLTISNLSGQSDVNVSDTMGDNTILFCPGGPLQSDTLGNILKETIPKK